MSGKKKPTEAQLAAVDMIVMEGDGKATAICGSAVIQATTEISTEKFLHGVSVETRTIKHATIPKATIAACVRHGFLVLNAFPELACEEWHVTPRGLKATGYLDDGAPDA